MALDARDPHTTIDQGAALAPTPAGDRPTIVLDTCVLIADPGALHAFGDAALVLPLTVIEELDGHKTRPDDVGRNAREVLRTLEDLRVDHGGSLTDAVPLPAGGSVRTEPNGLRLDQLAAFHLDPTVPDHKILASALGLQADGHDVTVVSADTAVRIKADAVGLTARDYRHTSSARHTAAAPGWHTVEVPWTVVGDVHSQGRVPMSSLDVDAQAALDGVCVNEFVVAKSGTASALARLQLDDAATGELEPTLVRVGTGGNRQTAWGLTPKSKEQAFALNLLLDQQVPIVALSGAAGTGKTILAVAAALEQAFERPDYQRVTILRPIISVGKADLGYLPGDEAAKLDPWFRAIVDAMVALSPQLSHREARGRLDGWVADERLTMEAVTYLRGRSLQDTYVLVDEAQNLEPSTIKTIVTRLGSGSKVVLCGDVEQIDNPYLSAHNNGLAVLADAFGGDPLFGQIVLLKGERSAAANLAAARM